MENFIVFIQAALAAFVVGMSATFIVLQIINHKKYAQ
jgi:hypothetical protein